MSPLSYIGVVCVVLYLLSEVDSKAFEKVSYFFTFTLLTIVLMHMDKIMIITCLPTTMMDSKPRIWVIYIVQMKQVEISV